MGHHKPTTFIDTNGTEVRLRRDRRRNKTSLTRGVFGWAWHDFPDPHPDGAPPTTGWVLTEYVNLRSSRKNKTFTKRQGRKQQRYEGRVAINEGLEDV